MIEPRVLHIMSDVKKRWKNIGKTLKDSFADVFREKQMKQKVTKFSHRKNSRAFTLVELTIVLLIISILILVFIPNLSQQREQATTTGYDAVVRSVETQLELYELEYGFPMSAAEMQQRIPEAQLTIYNEHKNR